MCCAFQVSTLSQTLICWPHIFSGSAVAVERIFSGGRDTIGIRRASLKAETIQTLMFVKARLRLEREARKGDEVQVL